jgi:hypothetical protein
MDGGMTDAAAPAPNGAGYTPDLPRLRRMYTEARTNTQDARKEAEKNQAYYDNEQWSAANKRVLAARRQPVTVNNRIAPTIDGILGVIEKGQRDPRALPRGAKDQDASEVVTDTLRFVADKTRWNRVRLSCCGDILKRGIGAVIIEVDEDGEIIADQIAYDDFFYDPRSKKPDFSDARYMGVARWQYADDVSAAWEGKKVPTDANSLRALKFAGGPTDYALGDGTHEDKPSTGWVDPVARRVLVVDLYHNDGGWKRCVFWAGGELFAGESEYVDERGRPMCPIEAASAYVRGSDNARYSPVSRMRGIQDEINMRGSKLLHEANSRQLKQTENAEVDANAARAEAARPDGVIPFGFEIVDRSAQASAQAQLLANAKADLERMGPAPENLGRQNASASGRSMLVRQEAGLTELTPMLGNIDDFEYRVYRQFWLRPRQFWTDPKYIRITDDEGAAKFLMVNEPIMGMVPQPRIDPMTGQPAVDPWGQPVVEMVEGVTGYKNRLAELDVDIILDSTPDTASIAQEQFAALAELVKIYGPQAVPFDDMLLLADVPKKRELIEKRKAREEQQQPPPPDPLNEAKAEELHSRSELNMARAFQTIRASGTIPGGPMPDLLGGMDGPPGPPQGPPMSPPGPPMPPQGMPPMGPIQGPAPF